MMTKLIYHKEESISGGISPFDDIIHQISNNSKISTACPYLGIDYLESILANCKAWRIISDIEAWILSHKGESRKKIANFIIQNSTKIHHYKNLHAKVIISENKALIGSANLTKMGILERVEMSVLLEDESKIKELNKWFNNLWLQSNTIEVNELQNYLSIVNEKTKNENISIPSTLTSKAPKIRAKLIQLGINGKNKIRNNNSNDLFSEQEILNIVISNNKIKAKEDLIKTFQHVKNNIPHDLRKLIAIRTDYKRCQISFIIQNYLIFRLPSHEDDKSYKKKDIKSSIYLIYPIEDIENLNTIISPKMLKNIQ